MQAVVRTPRIEIGVRGQIPPKLLSVLEEEFADTIQLSDEGDEELIDVFQTHWYRDIKSKTNPGDNLRIYRENRGLTQAQLGLLVGGVPRQHISSMERGLLRTGKDMAGKLAKALDVPAARFI